MKILLVGNFRVDYTTESHHALSLESLGHSVYRAQETEYTSDEIYELALKSDMLIFIHTHGWETPGSMTLSEMFKKLKKAKIPTVTYHLDLWFGLDREKDLDSDDFYNSIEFFFTVDKLMADYFNNNTKVKGVFLPAGVYDGESYIADKVNSADIKVVFTGSNKYHSEWPYRAKLVGNLRKRYGKQFKHYGQGGLPNVRGDMLNSLYASSRVVVGDTLCKDFNYPYYLSDRVFEVTGRGGFIIHPYVKGIEEFFEIDKEIVTYEYDNWKELYTKIEYYANNKDEREAIRKAGFERTNKDHTYLKRWEYIIDYVNGSKNKRR